MAAPTTVATAEVLITAASTGSLLDSTNSANRQLVTVTNNSPYPVTIVELNSATPPTITVGKGVVLLPGSTEWFWNGQGLRLHGRIGPLPAGETASDMVTGAGLWVVEKV